jgi:hypothetical protein
MMNPRLIVLAAWVACGLLATGVAAAPILMIEDGQSEDNIATAEALGHQVSTEWLDNITQMSEAQLAPYEVIFLSPGIGFSAFDNLREAVASGGSLQQYVASGGTLVLNVATNTGSQSDIGPGGADYVSSGPHNSESFALPGHPYLTGSGYGGWVLTPEHFDNWGHTDHGHVTGLPSRASEILENTDGTSLAQYGHDDGYVLISTLTVGWALGGDARGAPQENMINYAAYLPEPATIPLLTLGALLVARRRRGSRSSAGAHGHKGSTAG